MEQTKNKRLPLVSISCIAYNHEKYMRDAIEGFLMQKTNFEFEILIHDDASTDKTAEIIKEYEEKFPDLILPIYQTENQYSQGISPNRNFNYPRARGKYIALCEGDDYWTDPLKLQKQVDFLDANPDYIMCGHNVKVWSEYQKKFVKDPIKSLRNKTIDIYKLAFGNMIHTPSVVFKMVDLSDYSKHFNNSPAGDYPLYMYLAQLGKIKKFKSEMAVYRLHNKSVWSSLNDFDRISKWLFVIQLLISYFSKINNEQIIEILQNQQINVIRSFCRSIKYQKISKDEFSTSFKKLSKEFPSVFVNYFEFIETKIFPKNKYFSILFNSYFVRKLKNKLFI